VDLKVEIEAIKKTQTEEVQEMANLEDRTGKTDASITNRIQEMEKRLSGIEATIGEVDTKKLLNLNNS
jgi:predicted  nucleic acid-binding Zn-ribbon protein